MASRQSNLVDSPDHQRPTKMVKVEPTPISDFLPSTVDEMAQQSLSLAAAEEMGHPLKAANDINLNTLPTRSSPNNKSSQLLTRMNQPLADRSDGTQRPHMSHEEVEDPASDVDESTDENVSGQQAEGRDEEEDQDIEILNMIRGVIADHAARERSTGQLQFDFGEVVLLLEELGSPDAARVLNQNREELSQMLHHLRSNRDNVAHDRDAGGNDGLKGTGEQDAASRTLDDEAASDGALGESAVAEHAICEDTVGEEASDRLVEQDVAQEVADAAVAAEAARTEAAIDEQARWIFQLSRDNPDEFSRLVEGGIIDSNFLDRVNQLNHGVAVPNDDGQVDSMTNIQATAAWDPDINDYQDEHLQGNDRIQQTDTPQDEGGNIEADDDGAQGAPARDDVGQTNHTTPQPNSTRHDGHFIWLPNRNDGREENTICPACQCKFDDSDLLIFLNCGHKWCAGCLNSNYRMALRNRNDFPPRCCDISLEHDSVQNFLDEDILIDLITKMDEYADPDPIFCQTPKCPGGYIARQHIDGQWAACSECRRSTCIECRGPAVDHPMPEMHPKMLAKLDEQLAEKEGWKQCPGCKNLVEKSEGCNFMECDCGHDFCYGCGGTLMNNMPCTCQGTPEWVEQMNEEAADEQEDGTGESGNEESSDSEGESDDESSENDDDSDEQSGDEAEQQGGSTN